MNKANEDLKTASEKQTKGMGKGKQKGKPQ